MTAVAFPLPDPDDRHAGPTPPRPWGAAPVDTPAGTAYTMVNGAAVGTLPEPTVRHQAELPPVVADWLRTIDGRSNAIREVWGRTTYRASFHGVRLPLYAARLSAQAHKGAWIVACAIWRWLIDDEGTQSLRSLRAGTASGNLESLEKHHRESIKNRLLALIFATVATPIGWVLLVLGMSGVSRPLGALVAVGTPVAVVLLLGLLGRKPDRPIVERLIFAGTEVPKLTQDLVVHALASSRISGFDKAWKADGAKCVGWHKPPTRTRNGYECVLDLPPGVTVADAAAKTGAVASGLRRASSTVWLSGVREELGGHDGRLHLVVTDRPMRMAPMPPWPPADPESGPIDLFGAVPFGVDYLGEASSVRMMFRSGVIGALPRMGKSFTLRQLLTAAALDPTAELHIYDLKGGADFLDFGWGPACVAHAFRSGSSTEDSAYMLTDLRAMKRDMERRYTTVRKLTMEQPERIPNGKITRDLANDKALGLHPAVLAIDETQVCFVDWPDRKEFTALVTDLAKRGPAVGVMVWLATQSVDSKTIPTSISRMAGLRFCLRVTDHIASEQILGTGSHAKGYAPDLLSLDDMGIGYLAGEGDATKLVRTYLVTKEQGADGDQLIPILQRARAYREQAGRLTGLAAGDEPEIDETVGILDHLLEVWPIAQPKAWGETLAELLAERWPNIYGGWSAAEVSSALGPHGIRSRQVKLQGQNRQGYALDDFNDALEARDALIEAQDRLADDDEDEAA